MAPAPKKKRRWVWPAATVGALLAGVAIGSSGASDDTTTTTATPAPTVTVTAPAGQPAPAVTVTAPAPPAKTVTAKPAAPAPPPAAPAAITEDGTFFVGTDIKPGTYRSEGGDDTCYWARLKNTSGDIDSIIANGGFTAREVITIKKTDKAFETRGCGTWKKVG
jgi:hypothetical protein